MSEFQEVSGRSARSPCRPEYTKFKAQVTRMSMLPSRLLECTRQVTPPPLRPGQVEPFLPPTRAIFQPLWGKMRAERRECLSISLLPLEAAVPQNEVYHRRCWLAPRGKKMRFQGEADFCQGHPAQIWWTVIPGPGSLLVVHYLENFVDMTHFVQ